MKSFLLVAAACAPWVQGLVQILVEKWEIQALVEAAVVSLVITFDRNLRILQVEAAIFTISAGFSFADVDLQVEQHILRA